MSNQAAYQNVAKELTSSFKRAVLRLMREQGHSEERVASVEQIFNSPFGEHMVHHLMATTITMAHPEDPRAQRLADMFREEETLSLEEQEKRADQQRREEHALKFL